ncbi:MAG: hypothetical protein WAS26_21280, partial [Paracoccaceae bacterium]
MGERQFQTGETVAVLTTEPLGRVLDYKAPEGGCGTGDFVEVPLGPRRVLGVVWGPGEGKWDPAKLRTVNRVLDVAPMRHELRRPVELPLDKLALSGMQEDDPLLPRRRKRPLELIHIGNHAK